MEWLTKGSAGGEAVVERGIEFGAAGGGRGLDVGVALFAAGELGLEFAAGRVGGDDADFFAVPIAADAGAGVEGGVVGLFLGVRSRVVDG
jgi:hypothetical protein